MQTEFLDYDELLKVIPFYSYQKQAADGGVEDIVARHPGGMRQWIRIEYDGRGPNGEVAFTPFDGLIEEHFDKIGPAKLLPPELEEFYVCDAFVLAV